jgi:hypothetical protein
MEEKGAAEAKTGATQRQLAQKQATMKWLNDGYDGPKAG